MRTHERRCPNCDSDLVVREIVLYGFREDEEGYCPICKAEAAMVHGWGVEIGLIKNNRTIDCIRHYRQGVGAHQKTPFFGRAPSWIRGRRVGRGAWHAYTARPIRWVDRKSRTE